MQNLIPLLYVALGSMLGGLSRYGLTLATQNVSVSALGERPSFRHAPVPQSILRSKRFSGLYLATFALCRRMAAARESDTPAQSTNGLFCHVAL